MMDEAAKKMVDNVTSSNISAIVMAFIFMVFIGICLYLVFKWMNKQQEALVHRDNVIMDRFEQMQQETREQSARTAAKFAEEQSATAARFASVTKEQHDALERRDQQNIVLLRDTIETMGGLAESVRGLERTVARIESERK